MMNFQKPYFLILLFLVIIFYLTGRQGIKRYLLRRNKFLNNQAFAKLKLSDNISLQYLSLFIWLMIISLTVVSLARPLGSQVDKEIEESGRDIVVAFDISDSMKANDVNLSGSYSEYVQMGDMFGLSRFEAAKKVITGFIKQLNSDRVALVAFSESAFPLSPLTSDYDIFNSFLENLDFSYSTGGSTNIAEAIEVSRKRFKKSDKSEAKIIILISDGESQDQNTIDIAKKAKSENIIINTIGIGSKEGSKIFLGRDAFGNNTYKTYLGEDVITRLNDQALKEVARITGGKYFQVQEEDISSYLIQQVNLVKPNNYKSAKNKQYQELFQIFLILAIILIMLEAVLPLVKYYFQAETDN